MAFAPVHVQKSTSTATSSAQTIGTSSFAPSRPGTTTALNANLFDRFSRVTRANINNILVNLEDPEKVMEQALIDMQNDLGKIRKSYAEVVASQRRLEKQKQQAESLAEDWYSRAQLALQRNNEGLAREALARRQLELEKVEDLQRQYDVQAKAIDKLFDGMQTLEGKIIQSKAKKDEMASRARAAKTTKKVNDMLAGMSDKIQVLGGLLSVSSTEAFKRMEQKVEAMEIEAEASAELGFMNGKALPSAGDSAPSKLSLESEFKLMEQSAAVDKELANMKKKLLSSSSSASASLKDDIAKSRQSYIAYK